MKDDINPEQIRLLGRLHDEINGIIIFMTDLDEDFLVNSDILMVDGIFRTTPPEFVQVINIMGANLLLNTYLTVCHILIKGKKEEEMKEILYVLLYAFSKYYNKEKIGKEMKEILYVLLYAPCIKWEVLTEWITNLLNLKTQINQFLLYYKKIWLSQKETWHACESLRESILTNCALESYNRRLNAVLKASPTLEDFAKSLYAFDMKNYHELQVNHNKISYFLKKKGQNSSQDGQYSRKFERWQQ